MKSDEIRRSGARRESVLSHRSGVPSPTTDLFRFGFERARTCSTLSCFSIFTQHLVSSFSSLPTPQHPTHLPSTDASRTSLHPHRTLETGRCHPIKMVNKYDRIPPKVQQLMALCVVIFFARIAWLTHEQHVNRRVAAGPPQLLNWSWMPDRLKTEYINAKRAAGFEKSTMSRVQDAAHRMVHTSHRAVAN